MVFGIRWHDVPGRLATGGYILNAGLGKQHADAQTAAGLHGAAAGAYPFLKTVPPELFVKRLAKAEIAVGAILLTPVVPTVVAGAVLTGFAGGLFTMYLRTPSMHKPHSMLPTREGTALAKDSWMLGLGLGFVIDAIGRGRRRR